ncbi:MAG TPA: hypothetical protein EYH29_02905, partial [Caldilineales bacterium]|nr:hypothetical protein [Caldilineales bacterium]
MTTAIETLQNILALEARRGYKNDAVLGGLDRFAETWESKARAEAPSDAAAAQVSDIAMMLRDYPQLPPSVRASTVRHLQGLLAELARERKRGRTQARRRGG